LLHGRIKLDKIVIAVQGLESRVGIIHWLAPSTGHSGAQITIGWHHKVGRNGVFNIHWLAPPSWSQWSFKYSLAGTTTLVAVEKNGDIFPFSRIRGVNHLIISISLS
jgi:hypothetical protein